MPAISLRARVFAGVAAAAVIGSTAAAAAATSKVDSTTFQMFDPPGAGHR